ncbi:hypothetical protein J2X36_004534 [Methylobacterium sp. BE186]|nr:hypothetical protein [Methylobacterium sp. BE186]MDR7039756.1 hypothetical protein [Methylobacterium sp. BE186]
MKSMSEMTHEVTDAVRKVFGRLTGRVDQMPRTGKPSGQTDRMTGKK